MSDRRELREVTSAVSLGVLAQETVLVVGKVRRGEALEERDGRTLTGARDLLAGLGSNGTSVFSPSRLRHMDDDSLLHVFRAASLQAPDEPVRAILDRLANVLDRALRREDLSDGDLELLAEVQALFAQIGDITLARTNDLLDRRRKEPFGWTSARSSAS